MSHHAAAADLLDIAYAMEGDIQGDAAKKLGAFYTPPWLARTVAAHVLGPKFSLRSVQQIARLKILDPACGSGIFLIAAIELLERVLRSRGEEAHLGEISGAIFYGIDKNPRAVEATRALLARAAGSPHDSADFTSAIRCGDTLLEQPESLFNSTSKFDVVLGNPPYGLSRGEQLSAAENAALKEIFRSSRAGRINKYTAFLMRSFELLRTGGALSLVVPNSWLGIKEAAKLREILLARRALCGITVLPPRTFGDLGVETVIVQAEKDRSHRTILIRRPSNPPEIRLRTIEHAACERLPGKIVPLHWSASVSAAWEELSETQLLGNPRCGFEPRIALQAYAVGKGSPPQSAATVRAHSFHAAAPRGPDWHPYLQGSDVHRFSLRAPSAYLHYGPWLAEPQTIDRFSGPRIILREILARPPYCIAAAYLDQVMLYNKSVLHILGRDPERLKALLVILNSRFASFVLLTRGRKGARTLYPKLLNEDLKEFPLPASFDAAAPQLQRMLPADDDSRDEAVFEAYRLSTAAIKTIRRLTAARPLSRGKMQSR